jgi:hypothetical protein
VCSRLAGDFTGWKGDADLYDAQFERVVAALRPEAAKGAAEA